MTALFCALALGAGLAQATTASVVIDPGHGGSDPGAVGNGLQEKSVNLESALAFRDWLQADTADSAGGGSWQVHMTRSTDTTVSLTARADYANSLGVDYFMSIHANAGGGDGTETYAYRSGTTADQLAAHVQDEVLAHLGTRDRGVKYASFSVLVNTDMPADLHEIAFIDTWTNNAALLADSAALDEVGQAHLHALQRFEGLSAYTPGSSGGDAGGTIDITTYPRTVVAGRPFEVELAFTTDAAAHGERAQIYLEVTDATSWAVLDQVIWDNSGAGISATSGTRSVQMTVPSGGTSSVYLLATLTPLGGDWSDRYASDSTFDDPTTVNAGSGSGADADGDGWTVAEGDCDDGSIWAYPGATECACDHVDNDCDGLVDEGSTCGELPSRPLAGSPEGVGCASSGRRGWGLLGLIGALLGLALRRR
ncbi:MAG: N-acetylmuramoyl-L-alanine amidase [Pseudomonadota bacterium]